MMIKSMTCQQKSRSLKYYDSDNCDDDDGCGGDGDND